jgi:hypothetical protein
MTPERWLAIRRHYGITDRDWARIKALTDQVTPLYVPAALDDLDAPYRVGAVRKEDRSRFSGEPIGVFNGCAILVWAR